MKINSLVSLLTICSLAIACNKSSDSTGVQQTDEEVLAQGARIDVESRIAPNKYETTLATTTYEEEKKVYSDFYAQNAGIGCSKTADGKISNEYNKNPKVVDSALSVGDEFTEQNVNSAITHASDNSTTYSVAKIEGEQVVYNLTLNYVYNLYEGINLDLNSFFNSKPHGTKTYDKLKENANSNFNFSQKGLALIESMKNKNTENEFYWSCWISENTSSKNSVSLVNYEMNGKKVPALLNESTSKGKLKCEKRTYSTSETDNGKVLKTIELENGESSWKSISSRMVKSTYLVPCEGERLYSQSIIKANGKIVSTYSGKLMAPAR